MDAEEQTPLMVQRPGDSKLKMDANMGECKKEWMEQASRLSKEKLGLMEQLITANREKEEAVKELSQVRLQLQQKENENSVLLPSGSLQPVGFFPCWTTPVMDASLPSFASGRYQMRERCAEEEGLG